jgi:hypothetical protein
VRAVEGGEAAVPEGGRRSEDARPRAGDRRVPAEPGERVTVQALETMLDVTLAIVAESAAA